MSDAPERDPGGRLPEILRGRLALPVICAPMFIVSGPELAARVRALRPELPVVFMSGFPGTPDYALEPLLEKPFTLASLLAKVAGALAPAADGPAA